MTHCSYADIIREEMRIQRARKSTVRTFKDFRDGLCDIDGGTMTTNCTKHIIVTDRRTGLGSLVHRRRRRDWRRGIGRLLHIVVARWGSRIRVSRLGRHKRGILRIHHWVVRMGL